MFDPGPNPFGNPPVFLAAVGRLMTEVAGEVADGLLAHAFTTERYLREVTLPALGRGLAASGRTGPTIQISYPGMVVTGLDEEAVAASAAAARKQLAFYGSTPAYRPVLELHGWGDLQTELNTLSKRGAWDDMAALIDDEVLDTFAVVGRTRHRGGHGPVPLRRAGRPVQRLRPVGHRGRARGRRCSPTSETDRPESPAPRCRTRRIPSVFVA